jgi:hypothetical protein
MSLEEYLNTVVAKFRHYYDKLSEEEKSEAQLNMTFAKPCQIEFFSFEGNGQFMIVTFRSDSPDDLKIYEHIKEDPASFVEDKISRFKEKRGLSKIILKRGKIHGGSWVGLGENASAYFFDDIQTEHPNPEKYGEEILKTVRDQVQERLRARKRIIEYGAIEEEIRAIRLDIKRIEDSGLRARMLESTKKIDEAISTVKTLEVHEQRLSQIEQEIGGVRKMIGTTKEYQDFRVLATDVNDLKRSHVHKDVFESEIKRLDQRIDSLREIRFWSKRTIVDIILAIIATASTVIAALLAAGVLKF